MGYRWDCLECDFWSCDEDALKPRRKHSTITGHKMVGGPNVWKHPTGSYFDFWRKRNGYKP